MIGYVTLGTNNLARAADFYDALFALIGAKRIWEFESGISWGKDPKQPQLALMQPFNKHPATVGNGVMVAIQVDTRDMVDQLHAKALALGGQDEGAAGLRGGNFYAGYFRDLDGNKLNVFATV